MAHKSIKSRPFYSGPNHPLGAGYFIIPIGYTQIHGEHSRYLLVRLDRRWAIYIPLSLKDTKATPYHLISISTAAARSIAAKVNQLGNFSAIENIVSQIHRGAPGIDERLWELSTPYEDVAP